MAAYELVDVQLEGYDIPVESVRAGLRPATFAKLIFRAPDESDPRERMWVRVSGRRDDGGYTGTLASDPEIVDAEFGDVVLFAAEHVLEVHLGP